MTIFTRPQWCIEPLRPQRLAATSILVTAASADDRPRSRQMCTAAGEERTESRRRALSRTGAFAIWSPQTVRVLGDGRGAALGREFGD